MSEQKLQAQNTKEKWNKTSEAVGNMRTAMLMFLIDVRIFGFDIFPDFFGWLCFIGAVDILTGKAAGIERIRNFSKWMLWYEVAWVVLYYGADRIFLLEKTLPYLSIFVLCIRLYCMYIVLTAIAEVGEAEGGEEKTLQGLRRNRSRILVTELVVYLVAAVQGVETIGGWLWVPFILYFLSYISCLLDLTCLREETELWETEQEKGEKAAETVS